MWTPSRRAIVLSAPALILPSRLIAAGLSGSITPQIGGGISNGFDGGVSSLASAGNSAQVQQFFNRLATLPTAPRQALYAALINGLVLDGVWPLLDVLTIAGADSATAFTNLVNGTYTATGASLPYTADTGFGQSWSTVLGFYIDTGYNLLSGGQFAQNSACFGAWHNTSLAANGSVLFLRTVPAVNDFLYMRFTGDIAIGNINNSGANVSGANANTVGAFSVNRSSSVAVQVYLNGTSIASSGASASTTPENSNLVIGFGGGAYLGTVSAWWIGASRSAAQEAALYARVHTFLNAINPGSFP